MDRIDINDVVLSSDKTGESGEYLYCFGGSVSCSDGTSSLTSTGTYTDQVGNTHNTYEYSCGTDSSAVCTGNYMEQNDLSGITFTDLSGTEKTLYGVSGEIYRGFLGPYDYVPLSVSGDYVYLYNSDNTIDISSSACFLYDTKSNCESDATADTTTSTTNERADIKCLANNGAKPGDPLCCGQDGVVQNTKYNCPSEYPYCVGYKCGESWGKCSTTETN